MTESTAWKRICVVGLGYIGLPTAAVFASRQIEVVGVDVNPRAVETINRGEIHIVEPELDIIVRAVVSDGWLSATTRPAPAQAYLIAVPTPFRGEGHEPDLSYIEAAAASIAPVLEAGALVVLESTSPVGATEQLARWLAEARPDLSFPQDAGEASDIRVAHCPERVLPGRVMHELIVNDRIIGGMTPACASLAADLYQVFVQGECVLTDARTAEMAKLTENSFRDLNIAFANELSMICDRIGIDVWELIRLANRHPRVSILQPGPGVGGHCIAVDPWFIVASAPEEARIIRTAREVNNAKPDWVLARIESMVGSRSGEDLPVVACFGLAFKADIDDLRESPALEIVERLHRSGICEVVVVDPFVQALPKGLEGARLCEAQAAFEAADAAVLLVDHAAFADLRPPPGMPVVDTRGAWGGQGGRQEATSGSQPGVAPAAGFLKSRSE